MTATRARIGIASLAMAAMAFAASQTAMFEAPAPGEPLVPLGSAAELIQLVQATDAILWTTLGAEVKTTTVLGWPVETGDAELGGALVMEEASDGEIGLIQLADQPRSVHFELK